MNAKDLRGQTPDQLRDQLAQLKKESFNLRFQQATGQLENTARMRAARREAARAVFSSWPVACWKRRLKLSFLRFASRSRSWSGVCPRRSLASIAIVRPFVNITGEPRAAWARSP